MRALLCAALSASLALAGPDLDLILYGATGCVGHLAANHLASQQGLRWAIAGRERAGLEKLLSDLQKTGGNSSSPEIVVFSQDNHTDLGPIVRRAKAVATAAGPFSAHGGEYLLKACAENGVHYIDTSDEFYWQRWMVDRHDKSAQASGAKVAFSGGFCVLAGDLGSRLALAGLPQAQEAVKVDAWLETYNGGLSQGVIHTGHAIANASYPKEWDSDPYVLAPNVSGDLRVDTLVNGMHFPGFVKGEGVIVENVFGPYDARLLRRSFFHDGLKVQLRVGAHASTYGDWIAFLAKHPGSWSSMKTCPAEPILTGGSWNYRFSATTGQTTRKVVLSGQGDPGYHFTSWGLAEVGLCLAGRTPGCLREGAPGGVYTPMVAIDAAALSQRLESIGLLSVEESSETEAASSSAPLVV